MSTRAKVEIEAPTRQQKERAVVLRVSGKLKPGQDWSYAKNLLLLEGVSSDRVEVVLAQVKECYQTQQRQKHRATFLQQKVFQALAVLAVLAFVCVVFFQFVISKEFELRTLVSTALIAAAGVFVFKKTRRLSSANTH